MVDFVNKLESSDQKYQTNGNVRDENYNGKFLFTIKGVVSFSTYFQSMYFMPTRFLKVKINGVRFTLFQLGVFPAPDGTIYLVDINGTRYWGSI